MSVVARMCEIVTCAHAHVDALYSTRTYLE